MSRYSPNGSAPAVRPRERGNPALAAALNDLAETYTTRATDREEQARRDELTKAELYSRGFRPLEDAAAAMPPVEGRPGSSEPGFMPGRSFNDFQPMTVEEEVQRNHDAAFGGGVDRSPQGGIGLQREDYSVGPVNTSGVDRAIRTSDANAGYFDRVDQQNANLRARPGVTIGGDKLYYSPEAVAQDRSAGSERELQSTLHAIERMRQSGELTPEEVTDAQLQARGITRPRPRTGLTYDERAALQDITAQDRLDAIHAAGQESRNTRATPPGGRPTPAKDARGAFIQRRYENYLNEQVYGSPVYTPEQAMAKAEADANTAFPQDAIRPDPAAARRRGLLGRME